MERHAVQRDRLGQRGAQPQRHLPRGAARLDRSTSNTDRPMTTTTSGAADSSTRLTKAWYGSSLRRVARIGARERTATATLW